MTGYLFLCTKKIRLILSAILMVRLVEEEFFCEIRKIDVKW